LRQAIYGRLAGYEDVNDADRLARDPAMRAIVGREGLDRPAASSSEMGRLVVHPASQAAFGTRAMPGWRRALWRRRRPQTKGCRWAFQ